MAISISQFENLMGSLMNSHPSLIVQGEREPIAVAFSGGPDSLALSYLLSCLWGAGRDIHLLSVDHGLRPESADELVRAGDVVKGFQGCSHHILNWDHDGDVDARIQEEARGARYELMAQYCRQAGITRLYAGHHRDDQAETVLFRLAKGSGLDGLGGMRAVQEVFPREISGVDAVNAPSLYIIRPLLDVAKDDLVALCDENGLAYASDPSNENERFARVRLRRSASILEEEGLSAKRLAQTARRLERARDALEWMAEETWSYSALSMDTDRIVFKFRGLARKPEEVIIRIVSKVFRYFDPSAKYAPRMEKIEDLALDLTASINKEKPFRKRTLGGVVFECKPRDQRLIVSREK